MTAAEYSLGQAMGQHTILPMGSMLKTTISLCLQALRYP